MYAFARKLDYFSTECKYAPNAYRGFARAFIKDLENLRPRSILGTYLTDKNPAYLFFIYPNFFVDIISSGEQLAIRDGVKLPVLGEYKLVFGFPST